MIERAWSTLALLLVILSPLTALAGPRVTLEATGCDALHVDEARRVLAVELGASLAGEGDATAVTVRVTCVGGDARIVVLDPLSRKSLERRVALGSEDPRARGRLLGVAAAELVLASWSELAENPEPRVPSADPAAPPETVAAAREIARARLVETRERKPRSDDRDVTNRPFRAAPIVSRRAFFTLDGALWGGGVQVGQDVYTHLGWTADALAESGTITTSFASFRLTTGTVGGAILAYYALGPLVARAGAGLRIGVVSSTDEAGGAHTATLAPWGWPRGIVGLTLTPISPLVLEVAGEIGQVVLPVTTSTVGISDATIRGGWYGAQLGIGLAL